MTQMKRQGLGGFDKVLIGCGIGCAGLILVAVLGVAFGSMWVMTPGAQVATDVIADDTSLGVIRLHELADDPGTQELLTRVLERINEAGSEQQREQLPPSLRWISDLQAQQANTSGFNMLIPKEMTIAYEEAEDGSGIDFVAAANPRTMVRVFKTMLSLINRGNENRNVRSDYRGHAAYRFEDEAHLAFVRSTVLFASSRRALERAIDRFEAGGDGAGDGNAGDGDASGGNAGDGDYSAAIPDGDWDIEGAVGNETGLVDSLLVKLAESDNRDSGGGPTDGRHDGGEQPVASEALRLGFGLDVVSADQVSGRTVLECGNRRAAEHWRTVLEQRYQALRDDAARRGLDLELEARTEGDRLVAELRLLGIEDLLADAFTAPEPSPEDTQ